MHDVMSLSELQRRQPWTVPYSDNFKKSSITCPHLYATHSVLHAMKSLGKLATVFESMDHNGDMNLSGFNQNVVCCMAADLVTTAMRLANLYSFDLQFVLEERVREKNGIGFEDMPI